MGIVITVNSRHFLAREKKPQRLIFPDPNFALEGGIVAAGIPLAPVTLWEAYSFGIFPWPHEGYPLLWFCPDQRGVIELSEFKIPKSIQKALRKKDWCISWNQNFAEVIKGCQNSPRPGQSGTWITEPILEQYQQFHKEGYAHSCEVKNQDGELIGGLYGVGFGGMFAAESMFFKESYASSFALVETVKTLISMGLTWMDIQMVTPHMERFGGKYISRKNFLLRLRSSSS